MAASPLAGLSGVALLRDPSLNKGTAFTNEERDRLGLRGLLPPHVSNQTEQESRILQNLRRLKEPLNRYVLLEALQDRNEALFYRVVMDNVDEMLPIIYTPTVGLACQQFGHIYRRPRGLYVSVTDRGRVARVLANWPVPDPAIIVVTDGERILGLGDLGTNGMGIPIGKLAIYTACAGIDPTKCLPVLLDVGTNNEALLADPLYLGAKRKRITGPEYDALVDEFVMAAQQVFPGVLVQFEDFANHHAFNLLERYRDRIPCFNDDIQGTAAVSVAGIFSALRVTGGKLGDQTFLFMGAGEAATGIADLATAAMVAEGVKPDVARGRSWLFDSKGLVTAGRTELAHHKKLYAHPHAPVADFAQAVEQLKPTAIIGVAAAAGTFTESVLKAMARINKRPIVFALSNPTSKAECTAEDAYRHTDGRALYASGSPFDAVDYNGKHYVPRQGNNSYIFPGVGLGAIVSRTRRVTEEMFLTSARSLAAQVTDADLAQGSLYPPLQQVREVSARIAVDVAEVAYTRGLAGKERPADVMADVRANMYEPVYRSYL